MPEEIDFILGDEPNETVSEKARKEKGFFGSTPPKPNSVVVPLWQKGHVSFDPESSVSVFALLSLVLLLLVVLILGLFGIFVGSANWLNSIFTALGHAIVGVVGAILGSSVSGNKYD